MEASNRPAAARMFLLRSVTTLASWKGFRMTAALEMKMEQTTHRISAILMVPVTESLDAIAQCPPFDIRAYHHVVNQRRTQIGEQDGQHHALRIGRVGYPDHDDHEADKNAEDPFTGICHRSGDRVS